MHTQSASTRTLLVMVIAGSLVVGLAQAKDKTVIVSEPVSSAGLDLGNLVDAQALYRRLRRAAYDVCNHSKRVDLLPSDDARGCFEKALGNAVRQVHAPLVTYAYLANHTPYDAATWGIELPADVAKR
jgi:UrcA family protein